MDQSTWIKVHGSKYTDQSAAISDYNDLLAAIRPQYSFNSRFTTGAISTKPIIFASAMANTIASEKVNTEPSSMAQPSITNTQKDKL